MKQNLRVKIYFSEGNGAVTEDLAAVALRYDATFMSPIEEEEGKIFTTAKLVKPSLDEALGFTSDVAKVKGVSAVIGEGYTPDLVERFGDYLNKR